MRNLLVDISHVMLTYLVTYCSAFGTRFESIMAAMWDQRIFVTDRLNTHTHIYTHTHTHTHAHTHTHTHTYHYQLLANYIIGFFSPIYKYVYNFMI